VSDYARAVYQLWLGADHDERTDLIRRLVDTMAADEAAETIKQLDRRFHGELPW